jgi:predicted transcriptional regulator
MSIAKCIYEGLKVVTGAATNLIKWTMPHGHGKRYPLTSPYTSRLDCNVRTRHGNGVDRPRREGFSPSFETHCNIVRLSLLKRDGKEDSDIFVPRVERFSNHRRFQSYGVSGSHHLFLTHVLYVHRQVGFCRQGRSCPRSCYGSCGNCYLDL